MTEDVIRLIGERTEPSDVARETEALSKRTYEGWQAEQAEKSARRMAAKESRAERDMREKAENNRRADMDKAAGYGIMNASKTKGEIQVHPVGRINREIYKCITTNIVTDEVIITDERIQHIKERHPNDYQRYCGYLKEIVEHPQYIVETNKPHTALILKEFTDGQEQFKTVLRLTTSHDNPDFKNSIITFMKINEKEWKRVLKNKKILYNNE